MKAWILVLLLAGVFSLQGLALDGSGSDVDPYLINSPQDFQEFSTNTAYWAAGVHSRLTANLSFAGQTNTTSLIAPDLTESTSFSGTKYSGIFDGGGHTLSDLTIAGGITDYIGLFGYTASGSEINNLTLSNAITEGRYCVGSIAGNVLGIVSNCMATATVSSSGDRAGGISGNSYYGSVYACEFSGTVSNALSIAGGIVGYNDRGVIDGCVSSGSIVSMRRHVGGIAGYSRGHIRDSHSSCTVRSVNGYGGNSYAGGLVGYQDGYSISNCYASGSVTGALHDVGGFAGFINNAQIMRCYATGDAVTVGTAGGFAGYSSGQISESYATGLASGQYTGGFVGINTGDGSSIRDCYATGNVTNSTYGGGFAGDFKSGEIERVYSTGSASGSGPLGGLLGKISITEKLRLRGAFWNMESSGWTTSYGGIGCTSNQMQQVSLFSDNGWGNGAWTIDAGNEFPKLAWQSATGTGITDPVVSLAGDGSASAPWQIGSAAELIKIGASSFYWDKHFILSSDINLGGATFTNSVAGLDFDNFRGGFDGDGYAITNYTLVVNGNRGGFFCSLDNGAVVKNLILGNPTVTASGAVQSGMLAGFSYYATIENCHVRGGSMVSDNQYVGGLIGYSYVDTITDCSSSADVSGTTRVGGLVGFGNSGSITRSFATGNVMASSSYAGGLTGYSQSQTITDCYATGTAQGGSNVGGFSGRAPSSSIYNSYSTGAVSGTVNLGGFVGYYDSSTRCYSCFWNETTSGMATSGGGISATTADMQSAALFAGNNWYANGAWVIDEESDTPRLVWENSPGATIVEPVVTMSGSGIENDPWIIASKADLLTVINGSDYWDNHLRLGADIDLAGESFDRGTIGYDLANPFTGSFDGDGHSISNLTISGTQNVGFFGYISGAVQIKNLRLAAVDISAAENTAGGLIGYAYQPTVQNCHVDGSVTSTANYVGGLAGYVENTGSAIFDCTTSVAVTGLDHVGGLVGRSYRPVTILECHASGDVAGRNTVGGLYGSLINSSSIIQFCSASGSVTGSSEVGGLVGINPSNLRNCFASGFVSGNGSEVGGLVGDNNRHIENCYATGSVTNRSTGSHTGGLIGSHESGTVSGSYAAGDVGSSGSYVGGLIGYKYSGTVLDCYAHGNVTGNTRLAGLFAYNRDGATERCYSTGTVTGNGEIGGLFAYGSGTSSDCFWDEESSAVTNSLGGTGTNTASMMDFNTYDAAGWNISSGTLHVAGSTWYLPEVAYPEFSWQQQVDGTNVWIENGHRYEVVVVPEGITWDDARQAAIDAGGYLATLGSERENSFVASLTFDTDGAWNLTNNLAYGPWVGGLRQTTDNYNRTEWLWCTWEPINEYTAWAANPPTTAGRTSMLYYGANGAPNATWYSLAPESTLVNSFVIEYPLPQDELIDLSAWSAFNYNSAGEWLVSDDGLQVLQAEDFAFTGYSPTYFVGNFDLGDDVFSGGFRVQTTQDDDFIGLVFGFSESYPSLDDPQPFYMLTWKKVSQGNSPAGIKLLKVLDPIAYSPYTGLPAEDAVVLDNSFSTGWAAHTDYTFDLLCRTNGEIRVIIKLEETGAIVYDSQLITDLDPLPAARAGFLSYSQCYVSYYANVYGANQSPTAIITGGQFDYSWNDVVLDASSSFDGDGANNDFSDITAIAWDIGNDGQNIIVGNTNAPTLSVSFETAQAYGMTFDDAVEVALTVTDVDGLTGSTVYNLGYLGGYGGPVWPGMDTLNGAGTSAEPIEWWLIDGTTFDENLTLGSSGRSYNELSITNDQAFTVSSNLYVGASGSSYNKLVLTNGSSLVVGNNVIVGPNNSHRNELLVTQGSQLFAGGNLTSGHGNISQGSVYNRTEISGEDSRITVTGGKVTIGAGTTWTSDNNFLAVNQGGVLLIETNELGEASLNLLRHPNYGNSWLELNEGIVAIRGDKRDLFESDDSILTSIKVWNQASNSFHQVATWSGVTPYFDLLAVDYVADAAEATALGVDPEFIGFTLLRTQPADAPLLDFIGNESIDEGSAYSLMPPLLTGAAPLTWSLIDPPSGMTINPASGLISWAAPTFTPAPHIVQVKVENAAGSSTRSWELQVVRYYTVTFDPGDYGTIASNAVQTIAHGDNAVVPETTVDDDYILRNWYTQPTGGDVIANFSNITASATAYAQYTYEGSATSLEIQGPTQVPENTTAQFTSFADHVDQDDVDVTTRTDWSVDNTSLATIQSDGLLTPGNILSDQTVQVIAQYGGLSVTNAVLIQYVPAVTNLTITGPATVDENTTTSYTCTAYYDDATTPDVSSSADWSVSDSAVATVNGNGVLTTKNILADQLIELRADFGGRSTTNMVTVRYIPAVINLVVTGPAMVYEDQTANYTAVAYYDNGTSPDVTATAVWDVPASAATIVEGLLIPADISTDHWVQLTATHDSTSSGIPVEIRFVPAVGTLYITDWDNLGSEFGMEFTIRTGKTYQVQTTPALQPASWTTVDPSQIQDEGDDGYRARWILQRPADGTNQYYKTLEIDL